MAPDIQSITHTKPPPQLRFPQVDVQVEPRIPNPSLQNINFVDLKQHQRRKETVTADEGLPQRASARCSELFSKLLNNNSSNVTDMVALHIEVPHSSPPKPVFPEQGLLQLSKESLTHLHSTKNNCRSVTSLNSLLFSVIDENDFDKIK